MALSVFFIQCDNKDMSTVSLEIDGDGMHLKNKNIHLIFDDFMYCKVEFEVDGNVQSMNSSNRNVSDPVPSHFIILDDQVYKNFKISSHEFHDIGDPEYGPGKRLTCP